MHRNKSEAAKRRWQNPEYQYKQSKAAKGNQRALGYHHTEETKHKISEGLKGFKRPPFSLEHRRKIGEANKRRFPNMKTRHKLSKSHKQLWQDKNFVRRMMEARQVKPNRAECKLDAILQEIYPGEFVLNVKANIMTLGGKIPDFVNMNGKKQLIELFGNYWHDPKRFPKCQSPQERIDYFRQFGDWDTLIIWESELEDEAMLKQKLRAFVEV